MKFNYFEQETSWTCGPAIARMFLSGIEIKKTEKQLVKILKTNKVSGTRQDAFLKLAKKYNLTYITGVDTNLNQLKELQKNGFFIILSFFKTVTDDKRYLFKLRKEYKIEENHFAVVKNISKDKIYLLDPMFGPDENHSLKEFLKMWSRVDYFEKNKRWFFAMKK